MRCANCYRGLQERGSSEFTPQWYVHEHSGYEWCCVVPPAAMTARQRAGRDGGFALATCYATPTRGWET